MILYDCAFAGKPLGNYQKLPLEFNAVTILDKKLTIDPAAPFTQPYWLEGKSSTGMYDVPNQLNIGLPDEFIPQGTQEEIRTDYQLDAAGIRQQIDAWLAQ